VGISVTADRTVRFLSALGGASTSRVLNLYRTGAAHADDPEYQEKPLFLSPVINRSFLIKHRTRTDETYLFAVPKAVATKILIPFDTADLRAGGRSLFVDERSYSDILRHAGNYSGERLERDMLVLRLLNAVPSLDPFLLREHLRNNQIEVASCYFAISEGDQERMHSFVSQEMSQLVALAGSGGNGKSGNRLVSAMLSNRVNEKLEPLRLTLGLTGDDFREGVFSWARLSLLQMVDGQVLARCDGRAARDQHHHAAGANDAGAKGLPVSGPTQCHRDGARQWPACDQGLVGL